MGFLANFSLFLLTASLGLQRCHPGMPNLLPRDAGLVSLLGMLDLLPRDAGVGAFTPALPSPCPWWHCQHPPALLGSGGSAQGSAGGPRAPRPVPVAQRFPRGLTLILAAWLRCSAKSRCTAGPSAAPQSSSRRQRSAIAAGTRARRRRRPLIATGAGAARPGPARLTRSEPPRARLCQPGDVTDPPLG